MSTEEPIDEFFKGLDSAFRNFETANEPIIFQSKDFLVQWNFEVPIPTVPGSVVKYTFMTTIGDISFGAKFFDNDDPSRNETLIQACRVPSDVEPIMGSFKSKREGTLVLCFDNSFSWLNPKLLTYKVALFQPPFSMADEARSIKSRSLLNVVMEDIKTAERRLAATQDRFLDLEDSIATIEEKIAAMEEELHSKKKSLMRAIDEAQDLTDSIYVNLEKRNGLCIRCLTKPLLSHVLSYLERPTVALVCKYWYILTNEAIKTESAVKLTPRGGSSDVTTSTTSSSN